MNSVLAWPIAYHRLHCTPPHFILLAGPTKDESRWFQVSIFSILFSSFVFLGYLRLFLLNGLSNCWCFQLFVQFRAFGGQSIRTATGPIALILVPNGDLAKQIWSTFEKCRTFVGKGMGMWVSPRSNCRSWEGVENQTALSSQIP